MRILRNVVGVLVGGALAAGSAGAQINYTTQGFFSGPGTTASGVTCTTAAATLASCAGGGFTLLFTGTAGINLANNTITSLGTFNLTGTGNVTVPAGAINFTLNVNQTTPSSGLGVFVGAITGTVNTTGGTNFSSLIWTPNQFVTIGSTTYQMIYDNVGPAANIGLGIPINNTRGISALVTTPTGVPEPGTVALMATGLAGLLPIVVRRRRNSPRE
jgi:hypothetical protein